MTRRKLGIFRRKIGIKLSKFWMGEGKITIDRGKERKARKAKVNRHIGETSYLNVTNKTNNKGAKNHR